MRRLCLAAVCVFAPATARGDFRLPDDDSPPQVTIVAPAEGDQVDTTDFPVLVQIDANDGGGVDKVWLQIDAQEMPDLSDADRPFAITLDLDPGRHRLRAYASDIEGNIGDSAPVTFEVVDATAQEDDGGTIDRGCTCSTRTGGGALWLWLLAMGLISLPSSCNRRRRRFSYR